MAAAEDRQAPAGPESGRAREPTGLPRGLSPLLVVALWLVGAGLLSMRMSEAEGLSIEGELQGLLPERHRAPSGEPWLLLTSTEDPEREIQLGDEPGEAARSNLLAGALAIAQTMPEERVALAPPSNAVTAWLDAHGLYLLPTERHAELAERLEDERVSAAIQGLMARLSSPLFGVSGEEARRDPLGLAPVLARETGRLGHVRADDANAPTVTGAGDLLSADGRKLVISLRSSRAPDAVLEDARKAIADLPLRAAIVGPDPRREAAAARLTEQWPRLLLTLAAALTFVLALALRRIRPVLCLVACLATGVMIVDWVAGGLDPLTLPLLVLLPAFGTGAALRLQRISRRGWASAGLIATALLPLWVSPYPEWKTWSLSWLIAALALIVLVRLVMPALLALVRGNVEWRATGFLLAPMPVLGLALLAGLTTMGAWAGNSLRYAGADALRVGEEGLAPAERVLNDEFFDDRQIVEAHTYGATRALAMERAAVDAEALEAAVGPEAVRLDSPGSYVIPTPQLEERMRSLSSFELPKRMQKLHDTLEAQGLRADAFTEFLHGAADIEAIPTAQAALDDALGTWIERYLIEDENAEEDRRWAVRSFLQLRPKTAAPTILDANGEEFELLGPTIAARIDATHFRNRVGVYVAIGLWIGAFLVWLGTGSLAISIASAFAGLATESAVLLLLALVRQPVGPQLLPVLLLVGVAGMIAAGRACQAVDLRRPLVAGGMLTTGICQATAGLTLLVSAEPVWRQMGLVVAVGSAVAVGLGLFAAPGMCHLLRRVTGSGSSDDEDGDGEKGEES